jgi:FrmR/RcnR family transcriptional regulator, repressor of frmRAB operon
MAHTIRDKQKLLNRVARLKGQMEAVEKALNEEQECTQILHILSACRGGLDSLMAEVIEGHILLHIADPSKRPTSEQSKAAQELIDVIKSYLN